MELLFEYSKENIELLQAEDLILQKNALMEKLEEQLLLLGKGKAKSNIKLSAISPPLKVSKGEKHEGLPFLVLDYPRIFGQEDIFAIRYLVWWGKQISISLLLKGSFLKEALPKINEAIHKGRLQGFYIETEGSPWQNDLSETYKNPLKPIASEVDFLKISNKISISELNHLGSFYNSSFDKLLQLVKF